MKLFSTKKQKQDEAPEDIPRLSKKEPSKPQKIKLVQPRPIVENKSINTPHASWMLRKKLQSAQESIPYEYLYDDGIAYLGDNRYSLTYQFDDVNYTNTDDNTRIGVFEDYCYFINAADDTVALQLNVVTRPLARFADKLELPLKDGQSEHLHNCIRDYNATIKRRVTGSHSYIRDKYITLTIVENSYEMAQRRFEHIDHDVMEQLRSIDGCNVRRLNRYARMCLLREFYRPEDQSPISMQRTLRTGVYGKDLIAPYGMDFSPKKMIQMGEEYVQCLFFADLPQDLSDEIIKDISNVDREMYVSINMLPQDPAKAIKEVQSRLRKMDIEKYNVIARQSKAGVPWPEIPRELAAKIESTEKFLQNLRTRNEKMFLANILIMVRGKDPDEVRLVADEVSAPAKKFGCVVRPFSFDKENALNSIIPLGRNDVFVKRTFTTTSLAAFIPFNVTEIVQPTGFSYGKNAQSNNVLMMDRKMLMNPHGMYFGTSGSGKSMGAKAEIFECFMRTNDDMIIIDPDGEFTAIVEMLGGLVIRIANDSKIHFNPFEINEYYGGGDTNPVRFKADFIISLLEVCANLRDGIDGVTRSIIDRCVRNIYRAYQKHPCQKNIPTLRDFYQDLQAQPELEAKNLRSALEIYVEGSLNIFADETNVNLDGNRLVCFNTKELGQQLQTMAMSIIQDWCWNHISKNQARMVYTWLWNDEIHLSLRNPNTASWLISSWKRGRKYGLIATGMTQEIKDVLRSEDARTLIANSEFIMLYRQTPDMIENLSRVIELSDGQIRKLLRCAQGCGLYRAGNSLVEFNNRFESDTALFGVLQTNLKKAETYDEGA